MTLSRMHTFSKQCWTEVQLLNNKGRFEKHVRYFRRGKTSREDTKLNTDSLASPFTKIADSGTLSAEGLMKPFLFTVAFSGACFLGATLWEYENMRSHALSMLKKPIKFFKRKTDQSIYATNELVLEVKKWWNSLSPGERLFVPICAANILVFLCWRVPKFQPFMMKHFCSNPASQNVCIPMVLSTFSHYSGIHLLANMYVLHSFSSGAVHSLGQEQFLGLYMSAAVVSSFTSYLYKVVRKQHGLSLGASGAIMAVLGYVCTQYPDTRLGIIFLPFFAFSAGAAIKFIVGLDTVGVLLGWKFFDHAAHLGGAAFGVAWAMWGNEKIWQKREPILQFWHDVRGSIK